MSHGEVDVGVVDDVMLLFAPKLRFGVVATATIEPPSRASSSISLVTRQQIP